MFGVRTACYHKCFQVWRRHFLSTMDGNVWNPEVPRFRISRRAVALVFVAVAAGASLSPTAASAQATGAFSQKEYLALPRYCLAQEFLNRHLNRPVVPEAERKEWARRMGDGYRHIHHFCWALMDMRRAAEDPSNKDFHYRSALADWEYMIRNADPSFPLYPEVWLRKGITERFMGNETEAGFSFREAIRLKPDYTPAYAGLIDVYLALGETEEARAVVEDGLRAVPDSKILADKKAEIEARDTTSR